MGMATTKEVKITYEMLYEIARREKNRDEMQKLPENFFIDVIEYLKQKVDIVNESRKRFDLFSASDREKTEAQLKNIRKLLKELYERRESKILTMALNKSRTDTNLIDLSALKNEERLLFDALVFALNNGREGIVQNILEGRIPEVINYSIRKSQVVEKKIGERLGNKRDDSSIKRTESSDASDASPAETKTKTSEELHKPTLSNDDAPASIVGASKNKVFEAQNPGDFDEQTKKQENTAQQTQEDEVMPKPPQTKNKQVKFTDDVPKFVGSELEEYGPFTKDEEKTLPENIADILINAGKAVAAE